MQIEQQMKKEHINPCMSGEFAPFSDAISYLSRLCLELRSGSMYIYTAKADGAKISLSHGSIIDIKYKAFRGREALPHMREINKAKYVFKNDPHLREIGSDLKNLLPSNDIILMELGFKSGAMMSELYSTSNRKKILVVEDSAMARKTVVNMLTAEGYDVIEARDGLEAMAKLGEMIPDMVLLDLILPKMDGYEVLHSINKDNNCKNIPVIVLTSRDTLFDKLKGKMSGTNEYITKPVQPDVLLKKLEKYLG